MGKAKSDGTDSGEGRTVSEQRKSEITDKFKDIAAHFSKGEWAELSEWEKIRYKNVKRNYEAMLAIGLNVPKPAFMSRHGRRHQPRVDESSDSDEDWAPKRLVKNPPQMRNLKPPLKNEDTKKPKKDSIKKNQKVPSSITFHSEEDQNDGTLGFPNDTVTNKKEIVSVKKINRKTVVCSGNTLGSTNVQVIKETESRRYSLRNRERKVYTEERELCDDDYLCMYKVYPILGSGRIYWEIWCDDIRPWKTKCKIYTFLLLHILKFTRFSVQPLPAKDCFENQIILSNLQNDLNSKYNGSNGHLPLLCIEECPVHGPPVFIKDTVVEFSQPDRARLTLPEGLSIATSKIRKAGLGVWNEGKIIPKGVHFGPYEGVVSNEESAAISGYSWMISKGKQDFEYIDAKDESNSNWMRFVNCARKEEEQNLVAFQQQGKIYYRSCKPIPPRCELLVWYGDEYAKELGIKWTTMWTAKQESKFSLLESSFADPKIFPVKATVE
ncbi:histone-lysine N-methyltransferase PRDM9-like [Scyliorhinus torazame]|uniref:histone-lysine N-methyltransferase PRDM9-like n=1 Tax=Scyliorhinus torazame TaxID=75743 RepID=UPI003B5AD95A